MFLTTLSPQHLDLLSAHGTISLDAETTGLTPMSKPTGIARGTKIGPLTWAMYQRAHSATLNCVVRMRIWTITLITGEMLAWDLDCLTPEDRKALIWASIHGKTIIGHNIGFDLTWAVNLCGPELQPEAVLDTLLLVRCLRPGMTWLAAIRGAAGVTDCREVIEDGVGPSASLGALAAGLGIGKLDKSYQHARNWCVTPLSAEHYEYVLGDVTTPLEICRLLSKASAGAPWSEVCERLVKLDRGGVGGVYFRIYQHVPLLLARMSNRGMPIHLPTLELIEMDRAGKIPALVDSVIEHMPSMSVHRERLSSTQPGVPAALKQILGEFALANGFELELDADDNPKIAAKAAKLSGVAALDGWKAWDSLQHSKKIVALTGEYRSLSRASVSPEIRTVHALLTASAVTLRLTSESPNVLNTPRAQQGLPDELQFRSAVQAPPGFTIVSADYGQIELRIAAALAMRAIQQATDVTNVRLDAPKWIKEALWAGAIHGPEINPKAKGFEGLKDSISYAWRQTQLRGCPMAQAFRLGIDPHLLTGLSMAVQQGIVVIGNETPLEHLKRIGADVQKELKGRIGPQRQAAKALNFGLLYGMQVAGLWALGVADYGLTWTMEQAAAARDAWFEMYPEIAFWQLWMKFVAREATKDARTMFRRNPYSKALETVDVRLGVTHTLLGRPVVAEQPRELGNYSDQGTGADMMWDALVHLPYPSCDYVVNSIYDEVLMVVPLELEGLCKNQLQEAMLAAAGRALDPYAIPAEADPSSCTYWCKD